jgi:hypothetical protein
MALLASGERDCQYVLTVWFGSERPLALLTGGMEKSGPTVVVVVMGSYSLMVVRKDTRVEVYDVSIDEIM